MTDSIWVNLELVETKLPRGLPHQESIDSKAILSFIECCEQGGFNTHSLMIVRHGKVIAETWWEPFRAEGNHLLYSLTKSFASTAVGFAVSEGLFSLDDLVIDLFPEQIPAEVTANLRKLKVRHLLSMSVGHSSEPLIDSHQSTWKEYSTAFLAAPVVHEPGTHFLYNTPSSNMLSILVQKFSGETLDVFLNSRLLGPLGISGEKWTWGADFVWGGSGLHTTTESIAKLGLLYLNDGIWGGIQVLPAGWVKQATSAQVSNGSDPDNDWNQGYGFQFWRCRHNGFRGDGAFGQFCLVLPEYDAVIAVTSGESPMQEVLNAVWKILLPGFDNDSVEGQPIEHRRRLPPVGSVQPHPLKLHLKSDEGGFEISLNGDSGTVEFFGSIPISLDHWTDFDYSFGRDSKVAASAKAGWTADNVLLVKIWNSETPQDQSLEVSLNGTVTFSERGMFSPLQSMTFTARTVD